MAGPAFFIFTKLIAIALKNPTDLQDSSQISQTSLNSLNPSTHYPSTVYYPCPTRFSYQHISPHLLSYALRNLPDSHKHPSVPLLPYDFPQISHSTSSHLPTCSPTLLLLQARLVIVAGPAFYSPYLISFYPLYPLVPHFTLTLHFKPYLPPTPNFTISLPTLTYPLIVLNLYLFPLILKNPFNSS